MTAFFSDETRRRKAQIIAGALAIAALAAIVYLPILPGNFVMDDARLIGSGNALVSGNLTLRSLWFGTDFTLATFGWWLERLAFGNNPAGYHVVDLALQTISSLLLWRLLARLKIPGAWLGAALFAVHPVCVNSVARIAELKNTLSLPFFLLSYLAYLHYEADALYQKPESGCRSAIRRCATVWLAVSLIAFVLALLAKTTAVMLPAVLLMCAAWQRGRITRKDWLHTSPYFLLSLAFGLMSIWFQQHQALPATDQMLAPQTFWQRLAAAGGNFWFYLGKAIVPANLSVAYSRPPVNAGDWTGCLPLLLFVVALAVCWQFRRNWGRHVLFGIGCFAVMLFPALGFFDAQYQTMWQVSDHLQYPALGAITAMGAAALAVFLRGFFAIAATTVLLVFSILSFQRAQVFSTEENLVRDTLKKNPASWAAHNDLGTILAGKNDYPGAVREFTLSLKYNPYNLDAYMNLGHALSLEGRFAGADAEFLAALKMDPDDGPIRKAYAESLRLQGRLPEAIHQMQLGAILQPDVQTEMELASWFYGNGDPRDAVVQLRRALALNPDDADALNNLAWILATSPDGSLRNGAEAVSDAEKACRLTLFKRPEMLSALAAAYAEAGNFPLAIATAESAIQTANASGDARAATVDEQFLPLFRAGKPWREKGR
ncbi:MAG TPA: tetratricopeptide repeat protein [Verrucomicrobiae bacterium]|nr:tetratricopeptide repeat protein [Verrucomicrobiae bacterium]